MDFDKAIALSSIVTVSCKQHSGMGVIVGGRCVVTAAHCLPGLPDPTHPCNNRIEVALRGLSTGHAANARVAFADASSDLAIVASAGGGTDLSIEDEEGDFETLISKSAPASVRVNAPDAELWFRVTLRTHEGQWVAGKAKVLCDYPYWLAIHTEDDIREGTSGAPVFDDNGKVVGIVAFSATGTDFTCGPCLPIALPAWAIELCVGKRRPIDVFSPYLLKMRCERDS